jgi:amino acid adenylation domain-containing protein
MPADLVTRLRAHASADPGRPALVFEPGPVVTQRVELSYGELAERVDAFAGALAARAERGSRALLLFPTTPEFAVAFLGCLAAGVVAVPVPLPLDEPTRRRVVNVARDCAVSTIVSLSWVHELAVAGPNPLIELSDVDWMLIDEPEETGSAHLPPVEGDDIAFLQYTSGSTRTPRGVMVSHAALMANEVAINGAFGITADSTVVSWLPLHHDMGLIGGLLQPLYAGGRAVLLDPLTFVRRPLTWLETVSRERADVSGGPNFAYELCVRKVSPEQRAGLDLSYWRVAFNGAAQVVPATLRAFSAAFTDAGFRPEAHMPCYGLAEMTLLVASARPGDGGPSRSFTAASLEAGVPVFADAGRELVSYPLPEHADVRVVDPATLAPLPAGRTGEIVVAGPSSGSGYWADPQGTQDTFGLRLAGAGPFVRTGDLGFLADGQLFVQGRSKDLIVQRGRNLHPADLETDISGCDTDVRPGCGAVFSVDEDGDEAVVVAQEVRAGTDAARYPAIVTNIRQAVSRMHGVGVRTVLLLPPKAVGKTSSGKVQRNATRQRFLAGELPELFADTVKQDEAPTITLAQRLAGPDLLTAIREHLRDLLGTAALPDANASLAALGADSLAAAQLQYAIEEALGVALPSSFALRAPTLAALADSVAAAPKAVAAPEEPAGGYRLNAAQRALWFLDRAYPGSTAYNVTRALRVTGELDVAALTRAVNAVVHSHPSLRIAVLGNGGEPRVELRERIVPVEVVDGRSWTSGQEADCYRGVATTPFDLQEDPLLRVSVLRRTRDALLVLSLHHIVCDVSSLVVLVADLAKAYRCPDGLDERWLSPADREDAVLAVRGEELAAYWRTRLAGELPTLALPKIGETTPGAARSTRFEIGPDVSGALAAFAREAGLTVQAVLLTAYQTALHRLSGQPDLVVGVPAAGRGDRALASWVGYLVNVVPVRSAFEAGVRFAEFARQTQLTVLDAMDHQELPLADITRLVDPDRTTAAGALFQAMFAYYTTALPGGPRAAAVVLGDPAATLPMGDCALHGVTMPEHTTQSDIGLNVVDHGGRLGFELQYDPAKVSEAAAEQLVGTLRTLLAAIAADADTETGRLPLLAAGQVDALIAAGIGPNVPRPEYYLDAFERFVAEQPDAIAADDGERTLTYAELDQRANHVARTLRAAGVTVDANVVVSGERSVDYLVALVGIHKADGCYVPVSPIEAPRRAAAMVKAVSPVAGIASPSGRDLVAGTPVVFDLAELASGRSVRRPERLTPDQAACTIIHTSGSTGVPKAAVSTNYGVSNHIWQMVEYFGLGSADCVAQTGPVSFDISVWQLLTPLVVGGRVRIVPEPHSQSPAALLRATVDGGVTMLELVPSAIIALLDAGLASSPHRLRVILSTGEALTPEVPRRWIGEMPCVPMHNAYGPAECTDDVTAGLCASTVDGPVTTSIGTPLANTSVFVLDENLVPVPVGVVGSVYVGGGAVGRGYRGNPRRTAEMFVPDPWATAPGGRLYRTGDLARITDTGDIDFLGRADSQTKIRGLRIEAGEVEAALRACPGVTEAALSVHTGSAGTALVGYVVIGPPTDADERTGRLLEPAEDDALRAALAESLPRHMIPTLLVRLPRIPRSKNGKVDYPTLRTAMPEQRRDVETEALDDPFAAAVGAIWARLLRLESIGRRDSFFQLGGHSLLALAMIDRVNEQFGVDLAVDAVFAAPRLGEFVELLRRADSPARERPKTVVPRNRYPAPASASQQRFWFLHELEPGRATYAMPGVLRLRGDLDEDALDAALRATLARHPVLLARFADDTGTLTWTPAPVDQFDLPRIDLRGPIAEFGADVFDALVRDEANQVPDLRTELPFRALLARLDLQEWGLFVSIDHIVCDGWSLSVFLADLATAYNRRGGAAVAAENGFADYCHQEATWREHFDRDRLAELWQDAITGPVARSPLPSCAGRQQGAGQYATWIEADLAGAIRDLAVRAGATPYMVFATALSALTHPGGAERATVLLGTLIAQRERPEWRSVVGPLLNVSVLATGIAPTDTVEQALANTRAGALRAYRSSQVSFQDLVALFEAAPGGDGSPFEVMLVMQPQDEPVEFAGLTTELSDVDTEAAPYPLTVDIEQRGERYRVSYRYATDRHDHADVAELAKRLDAALGAMVADPARTLAEILPAATAVQEELSHG